MTEIARRAVSGQVMPDTENPPMIEPSAEVAREPGHMAGERYTRPSAALRWEARHLYFVAEHPGSIINDISLAVGASAFQMGPVALALKDAVAAGWVRKSRDSQPRWFITREGLVMLGYSEEDVELLLVRADNTVLDSGAPKRKELPSGA